MTTHDVLVNVLTSMTIPHITGDGQCQCECGDCFIPRTETCICPHCKSQHHDHEHRDSASVLS